MGKKTCEICGKAIESGFVETHHVVPVEVTTKAGVPDSRVVTLCGDCHQEVHRWYSGKVTDMAYDPRTLKFRAKSWPEMVKEYESAYDSFVRYKQKRIYSV
jgi:predicted HNH restriction endonuclease